MPKTYSELMAEIKRLEAQAEEIRTQERAAVIERMRAAMAEYGITVKDLQSRRAVQASHHNEKPKKGKGGGKKKKSEQIRVNRAQAYADGDKYWSGYGRMPGWLKDKGSDIERFKVTSVGGIAESTQAAVH